MPLLPVNKRAPAVMWGSFFVLISIWIVSAALGAFWVTNKVVVLPFILVAAVASVGLRAFFRDWALFVALLALFDSLRGGIFLLINNYDLPVYMGYAIRWEKELTGVPSVAHLFQDLWLSGMPPWFEGFLVMLHAFHYLFFLLFAFLVYRYRPAAFSVFKKGFLATIYLGLFCYLCLPTVPPWMAANDFGVLPPIARLVSSYYSVHAQDLFYFFNTNEIAAMPSLHVAFPMFCALFALRYFRPAASLAVVLYALGTSFASIFLGEHYLVDAVAGVLLAGVGYLIGEVFHRRPAKPEQIQENAMEMIRPSPSLPMSRMSLGIFFLVTLLAFEMGLYNRQHWRPLIPDESFIAAELQGVSGRESFYQGLLAAEKGDWATAREKIPQGLRFRMGEDFPGVKRLLGVIRSDDDASQIDRMLRALPSEQRGPKGQWVLDVLRESFPHLHGAG